MRSVCLILLTTVVHITCLCFNSMAAEEVLFERKMTQEDAEYFTFSTHVEDNRRWRVQTWDQERIEWLKGLYRSSMSDLFVVKVVFVYDKKTREPIMSVTRRELKPVATMYERELPEEDLERYELEITTALLGKGVGRPKGRGLLLGSFEGRIR